MEVSKDYITKLGGFKKELPYVIDIMVKSIPGEVPRNLALAIVLSEVSAFVSSFRNNILLNTPSKKMKTVVPMNSYIFSLSPSGISKDRTKNTIHKLLAGGYKELDKSILADLKARAKAQAIAEGDEEANYYSYMNPPIDQEFKFGTTAGVATNISEIGNNQSLGSPVLLSSEIGSDLATRGEELIKTFTILSDLYDLGTGKFDTVKSQDAKLKPVESLPVNFLVFGSEKGILMDSANKKKFKSFFNQQLARRCIFTYTTKVVKKVLPKTVEERKLAREEATTETGSYFNTIYDIFEELGVWLPHNTEIFINPEVDDLFEEYLNYNDLFADTMSATLPISQLARKHKQWLALKLSGVYAMIDKSPTIEVPHYIDAINTVEILAPDLEAFEQELDKEPYEVLDGYCVQQSEEGKFSVSMHELKKLNFIEGRGGAESKLKELCVLLNDYSKEGIYNIEGSTLNFEKTISTEVVGVSLLNVDTSAIQKAVKEKKPKATISQLKQELSWTAVYGYDFVEKDPEGNPLRFEDYKHLLEDDYAYTPFKLKEGADAIYDREKHPKVTGGVRGKDNIASGAKFVVLDVDTSTITDEEAHFLLEGINHHIARTSDPDNPFKFRVLVEMDMIVNLDSISWKHFIKLVGEKLGLNIDPVAQSQIFYSYKGREVLSEIDGEPMAVKDLVVSALKAKEVKAAAKVISKPAMKALLDNPMATFGYAFEHPTETGVSSVMMQAAYYAKDLGCTKEYCIELMKLIQKHVEYPLTPARFTGTVLNQIERWVF
jgi:hypothetical protein